jgi:TonB family protein
MCRPSFLPASLRPKQASAAGTRTSVCTAKPSSRPSCAELPKAEDACRPIAAGRDGLLSGTLFSMQPKPTRSSARPPSVAFAAVLVSALLLAAHSASASSDVPGDGKAAAPIGNASAPSVGVAEAVFTSAHRDRARAHCFHPAYPVDAIRAKAEGSTTLEITIDPSSTVTNVVVAQSAGNTSAHKLLDQTAIDDIATCPIDAGKDRDGHPVGATFRMTFNWLLESPGVQRPNSDQEQAVTK